ncbi:MAG: zinc ribbon domain-containing protein [Gemmatimonadota bacterium]|nr:MAG: zinc ribbon domain-containing protein [Gemmatimonadota bacterium]
MVNILKKMGVVFFVGGLLFTFVLSSSAQEAAKETITCPKCRHTNDWSNDFCINCGYSLKEAKATKKKAEEENLEAERTAKKALIPELQEEKPKETSVKIYEGPIDPCRLFLIPTAEVLNSLEISLGGGSIIGEMKEEKRPFLGRASIGLGDVAEIEASTIGMISGLAKGSAAIPTAAFKLKILPERDTFPYVGFAGALRSSLWHSEERDTVKFQKRVSTLYFVGSKTFGALSLHLGTSISDLRIRTKYRHNNALLSPTPEQVEAWDKEYVNKNITRPFAGLRVEANPKTLLMIEFEYIPEYDFDEEDPTVTREQIEAVWMVIAGLRFFAFDWLPLDSGVMYRGDYHGIGDMHIHAGVNINLPLPKIVKARRAK